MKLNKNDIITLNIDSVTNLGFGVGRYFGQVVFVSDAITGDSVRVKVIKCASSYCVGKVEEYLILSRLRDVGRCKNSKCKSCAYKSLLYSEESKIKRDSVVAAFRKCGLECVEIGDLISSPAMREYRNKAQYPISKRRDGEYEIGFFSPKSHRVTEAADCPLSPSVFTEILNTLRAFFKKYSISVYDEISHDGLLRHVYLRRGEISQEILLTIVINGASLPHSDELVTLIRSSFPDVVGILLNENRADTNVVLGEKFITLFGKDYITDTLAGVKLKITAPSFYQVNHDCAELLYAKARELAELKHTDIVLDLYCGAGSIGLSIAKDCLEVIGIEIVESAVECAKHNALENGIENAAFYAGDASDAERLLDNAERTRGEKIKPDVVILDPPRAGTSDKLIGFIARLQPQRVVYVSCNPQTLARDVSEFIKHGYHPGTVTPVDMFPMTGHVESLVCLTKQTN